MLKEGANLYDMLSRMPNYGIGYRVFRDSWQMKGCDARVSPVQGVWRLSVVAFGCRWQPAEYHWLVTKVMLKTVSPHPARSARTAALLLTTQRPWQFNTRGKAWGRLVWKGTPFETREGDVSGSGRIRGDRKREWHWMEGSQLQRDAEAAEAAAPSSAAEASS